VIIIGFEKSVLLSKSVMNSVANSKPSDPIRVGITNGVAEVGLTLILESLFEIVTLLMVNMTGVHGVIGDFSLLAACIVAVDCFFLFTYFVAVLALKLEMQRIREKEKLNNQNDNSQKKDTGGALLRRKNIWLSRGKMMLVQYAF